MIDCTAVFNERDAREARAKLAEIESALSSERCFEPIVAGLPLEVVNGYRRALAADQAELKAVLDAYEAAKVGDCAELKRRAGDDPGVALIIARIARGLTQKELARRLGVKEQQIQRYEADRYRSISLANYRRIASLLGVLWKIGLSDWVSGGWSIATNIRAEDVKIIIKHAKEQNWFESESAQLDIEDSGNYLHRYVTDHILNYGTPTLLRTGLNVEDHSNDVLLLAWKARVTRRAETIIKKNNISYSRLDISWLLDLVRLSSLEDGPAKARNFLLRNGILLIAEAQIPGMKIDGAAFLVGDVPVVGLTLRRDTLDNFWFTLLHELAHVVLHYRVGLRAGFFDDTETTNIDEMEQEANEFASNMLIPDERWKRSPARIAKSANVIEKFARELNVSPAIAFGRLQKERGDYATFSNKIGRGLVRRYLLSGDKGSNNAE